MAVKMIEVLTCTQVHAGTGSNGQPYQIYEIAARDASGVLIQHKLTSFTALAPGPQQLDVSPYSKNGQIVSYTLKPPGNGGGGGGGGAKIAQLEERISLLEQNVDLMRSNVAALMAGPQGVTSVLAPAQAPAQGAGATFATGDDSDIPFVYKEESWDSLKDHGSRW